MKRGEKTRNQEVSDGKTSFSTWRRTAYVEKRISINLEHQKHGEYGEGEKPDPDFKHRNPKPAQQLFLTEKHLTW